MIYFKINSEVYNKNNLQKLYTDYPLARCKAVYRIIKKQLKTILAEYPKIDIVINYKNATNIMGRLYLNRLYKGKEYQFLGDKNKPCIVLFRYSIDNYYKKHNVKGLLSVLYHEYGHYKQYLKCGKVYHDKRLKHEADNNVDIALKYSKGYLK